MKKSIISLLTFFVLLQLSFAQLASANELVHFSKPTEGKYEPLHLYTLNWSGDVLDRGGLNLSEMKVTSDSSKADVVINQYGAIGANAIIDLGPSADLEAPIDSKKYAGQWKNSFSLQLTTYLIKTHDNKFAKIRITDILPTKVFFEYVIETESVPEPKPEPKPQPEPQPKPEPKPQPEPQPKPEPIPQPEPQPKPEPKPQPEPSGQWTELNHKTNIAKDKTWKVTFSKAIDFTTVTNDNVFVLSEDGKRISTTVKQENNGKTLLITAPAGGYEFGKTYTIYIKNTVKEKASQKPLKENIKMKFTTQQQPSQQPPTSTFEVPKGLSTVAGNGKVTLDWYNLYDPSLLGYYVYVSEGNQNNFKRYTPPQQHALITEDSIIDVVGLTNDTTYYFYVTAVYSNGESSPSSTVSATPTAKAQVDWTGTWASKYGTITFVQTGNEVKGTYGDNSTIVGTVSGKTLTGYYKEPAWEGDIKLTMSDDGKSFTGSIEITHNHYGYQTGMELV